MEEQHHRGGSKMSKLNLSQKLFTQKDGKKFAYADDIKNTIKELKKDFGFTGVYNIKQIREKIKKVFGKELYEYN